MKRLLIGINLVALIAAGVTIYIVAIHQKTLSAEKTSGWAGAEVKLLEQCSDVILDPSSEDYDITSKYSDQIVDIATEAGLDTRYEGKQTIKQALLLSADDYKDCLPDVASKFRAAAGE